MERRLSVLEHLDELRGRIILSLASLGLATAVSLPFASHLLKIIKHPAGPSLGALAFFSPEEAFVIYMRISFLAGLVLSFPVITYQLWFFVLPAMNPSFRRGSVRFIIFSTVAFLCGCAFSYLVILPNALKFLLSMGQGELIPVISASNYISFTTTLILITGLVFEMPVLSYLLTKAGVLRPKLLSDKSLYAIVGILIFSAVITPTGDAFNMIILAIPMVMLYFVSIWVSWLTVIFDK